MWQKRGVSFRNDRNPHIRLFGRAWDVALLALVFTLLAAGVLSCSVPAHVLLPVPNHNGDDLLWGFVDENGKWVIDPRFEDAYRFHEGLAAVKLEGRWGYVDESGTLVIQPQFTEAYRFDGGLARVATGPATDSENPLVTASEYGFVDKTGQIIIPAQWDDAGDFGEGLAPVMEGEACGFIDTEGQVAIPLDFESVLPFSDGLACAASGGKWGYIDKSGNWTIRPRFQGIVPTAVPDDSWPLGVGCFESGLAPIYVDGIAASSGSQCYYIDKTGKKAFDPVFARGGQFSEGLAPVQLDKAGGFVWGFIDTSGALVIEPQFDFGKIGGFEQYLLRDAGFHQGLAAVAKDGKVGYIDSTGSFVIEPQFAFGFGFFDGFAYVHTGDSDGIAVTAWTFIDRNGRVIYGGSADWDDAPTGSP